MWNHCFFLLSLLCVCVNALLCVHYTSLLQSFGCKSYYWYIQTSLCNARKFNVAWMLCWIVWEIQLREASCDQRWTVLFIYMVIVIRMVHPKFKFCHHLFTHGAANLLLYFFWIIVYIKWMRSNVFYEPTDFHYTVRKKSWNNLLNILFLLFRRKSYRFGTIWGTVNSFCDELPLPCNTFYMLNCVPVM